MAGFILAAIALIYFGQTFLRYWRQASDALFSIKVLFAGVAALWLGAIGYIFSAYSWVSICRALGLVIEPRIALHIYFVSQFGKYLPGNIAQHAGRLAMGMQRKFSGSAIVTSQIIEIALVIGTLVTLALATGWYHIKLPQIDIVNVHPVYVIAAILFSLIFSFLFILAFKRFDRFHHLCMSLYGCLNTRKHFVSLLVAVGLILGNAVAASLALYAFMMVIGGEHHDPSLWMACSVYTVSWLAGFMTPGAPAGLGVREAVMLTLLSQTMTGAEAAAVSLAFRITTTLTDSLIFGVGICLRPSVQLRLSQ